ncbi:hypothetical protein SDC9_163403 [bioreactor metagenome]|uniref:Uncharacterized protein n=1 Tax=bioreactor metagenome TaxID=1076179 RepID=A0A645FNR3_9ZZZZ
MYLFREVVTFIRAITDTQCCQHIPFGSDTHTGTASLQGLTLDFFPEVTFGIFYLFRFGVSFNLFKDQVDLFRFQIHDIIHNTLRQADMLAK